MHENGIQRVFDLVGHTTGDTTDGGEPVGRLQFLSSVRGDDAEIRITDTGCGIAPEVKDKIFGLYFTTKQGGSGIGLAMTFRIVQLHDGTIEFTSEPGKSTTFIIRIPTAVSSS